MQKSRSVTREIVVLIVLATAAIGLGFSSSVFSNGVVHSVHVGGPDGCGDNPGCDKNFSFSAVQFADGSATGQLADRFNGNGGADGIQATIDCLVVDDGPFGSKVAWVSGTITKGQFTRSDGQVLDFAGLPVWAAALDWGKPNKENPDLITFSNIGDPTPCYEQPQPDGILPLFDGQVTVK